MADYIIVGQGICGTFLSYYLQKEGKDVLVIDKLQNNSASRVSSGVINPVTGRRIVKTWLIDEVQPFAWEAYNELENRFGISLIRQCNVLDFFASPQMREAFEKREREEPQLLQLKNQRSSMEDYFRFNYGTGEINPCYQTDIHALIFLWQQELLKKGCLWQEEFNSEYLTITADKVVYKNVTAKKIIFCEGTAGSRNVYFEKLPFAFNKGEALIAEIRNLPQTYIYKQGINIVPWKEKDLFWIGSNYTWEYNNLEPTEAFRRRTEEQLKYWLKLPFTIVDHMASERPANVERRPFVGLHPVHLNIGILNGMGTKGCSLAPYFAHQLTQHLLLNSPIEPLADVSRFTRILSR